MDYASLGSLAVAFIALVISIFNASKKETKEFSMQMATIMVKLDNISGEIRDFKTVREEMRLEIRENRDDIIKVKETLRSALAKIDDWKQVTEKGLTAKGGVIHESDHK